MANLPTLTNWSDLIAALSVRPGRWALLRTMGTKRSAWSAVRRFGKKYPTHDFTSRGCAVWGRQRVGPDMEAEEMQWR